MSPERLRKARALFESAAAETGAARDALLADGCVGDAGLYDVVQRMIAVDGEANPVLDSPLPEVTREGEVLPAGSAVGRYRIVREIGSGGMGTVYLAVRDGTADGKFYALKIMRWPSAELSRRFRQEQAILSRLEHPNVARLLDSGTTPGEKPYFVMEYVEGEPIRGYCERRNLTFQERLGLFRQVCAAVWYLHQNLVIHRDLKPGNILVTADGTVKLVDFGIAKLLEASALFGSPVETSAGLMTPDYASPEQIRGEPSSTLTDVYALGILLYELLTGTTPFAQHGAAVHETLRRICEEEPLKPSSVSGAGLDKKIRGELDNIVLKAIRKEPERRYASVEQFDEDVRRYLEGLPVHAHGDSLSYQGRKFVARHRGSVAAAMAMLLLLCGGIVATTYQARIARQERSRAEAHAREAERARAVAEKEQARAEREAAIAKQERANAERRLEELRKLAFGVVRIYESTAITGPTEGAAALIAQSARDSVLALQEEGTPGLAGLLEQTSVAAHSFQLAGDSTWNVPTGWTAHETVSGEFRVGTDRRVVHSGKASLFLRSLVAEPAGIVSISQQFVAAAYRGRRVRVSAFLRSERAAVEASLWFGAGSSARNVDERAVVRGTTPWKRYELVMDVPVEADWVRIWLTMRGTGTLWADEFHIEQVSNSVPLTKTQLQPENLDFKNSR